VYGGLEGSLVTLSPYDTPKFLGSVNTIER